MSGLRSRRYTPSEVLAIKDFLERRLNSAVVAQNASKAMGGEDTQYWSDNTARYYRLVESICRWLLGTVVATKETKRAENKRRRQKQTRFASGQS